MQVGTATSVLNPTSEYFNSQGTWVTYILVIVIVHFVLLCVPFLSTAVVWTLTCSIHNVVSGFSSTVHYHLANLIIFTSSTLSTTQIVHIFSQLL